MTNGATILAEKREGSIGDTTKRFLFVENVTTTVKATTTSRIWVVLLFKLK